MSSLLQRAVSLLLAALILLSPALEAAAAPLQRAPCFASNPIGFETNALTLALRGMRRPLHRLQWPVQVRQLQWTNGAVQTHMAWQSFFRNDRLADRPVSSDSSEANPGIQPQGTGADRAWLDKLIAAIPGGAQWNSPPVISAKEAAPSVPVAEDPREPEGDSPPAKSVEETAPSAPRDVLPFSEMPAPVEKKPFLRRRAPLRNGRVVPKSLPLAEKNDDPSDDAESETALIEVPQIFKVFWNGEEVSKVEEVLKGWPGPFGSGATSKLIGTLYDPFAPYLDPEFRVKLNGAFDSVVQLRFESTPLVRALLTLSYALENLERGVHLFTTKGQDKDSKGLARNSQREIRQLRGHIFQWLTTKHQAQGEAVSDEFESLRVTAIEGRTLSPGFALGSVAYFDLSSPRWPGAIAQRWILGKRFPFLQVGDNQLAIIRGEAALESSLYAQTQGAEVLVLRGRGIDGQLITAMALGNPDGSFPQLEWVLRYFARLTDYAEGTYQQRVNGYGESPEFVQELFEKQKVRLLSLRLREEADAVAFTVANEIRGGHRSANYQEFWSYPRTFRLLGKEADKRGGFTTLPTLVGLVVSGISLTLTYLLLGLYSPQDTPHTFRALERSA